MKTESKKAKWQRYAKQKGVKFQKNDTIAMLISAVAGKLTLNVDASEKEVEKAILLEDKSDKKSVVKTIVNAKTKKKVQVSKPIVKNTHKKESKKQVKATKKAEKKVKMPKGITEFDAFDKMKAFCIANSLNKLPGYVLETKKKKTDFWNWIVKNIDKAITPKKEDAISSAKKIVEDMNATPVGENNKSGVDLQALKDYGHSILHYINDSPSVRLRGVFRKDEIDTMIESALKHYNYQLKSDSVGKFLIISDNKNSIRVPEKGYLPM